MNLDEEGCLYHIQMICQSLKKLAWIESFALKPFEVTALVRLKHSSKGGIVCLGYLDPDIESCEEEALA